MSKLQSTKHIKRNARISNTYSRRHLFQQAIKRLNASPRVTVLQPNDPAHPTGNPFEQHKHKKQAYSQFLTHEGRFAVKWCFRFCEYFSI